ncbi:MAG: iron-containing alcohol dehydrogenase [Microbacterium sp.]|uniref:iron-containing alcohol dehydrogenase n=1 Tax=Microbacterium sp. TaxID=51671 RepID=UPI001AD46CBC|nr:iron-containing alcohol dehydrogenase [Microbacterium sp.]MBN9190831.1 iron-containing alcohol dehydrogenase [Microbacterium sp.]MBN9193044.1 iron-containing alcohol dehydrogenase [Microbacterium sp.]MBN9194943.1 iron-containing alcohol dehydrogenase [Microbacterium sp.]
MSPATAVRSVNDLGLGLLRQPRQVLFGPGQRRQLPEVVAAIGRTVLVVTDERMATTAEFGELVAGLRDRGLAVAVYDRTEAELPRENVVELVDRFAGESVDVLVGIGGGSCMDLAKVASVVLANGGDVRDYYGEFLVPGPGLPVVTVPTTGGTGAEVTCISVVFDAEREMKVGVASPYLEAHTTVIDPEFTLSAPPGLTAATGADALSHLVEAFTGRAKNPAPAEIAGKLYVGKNVLADVYARTGIALIGSALPRLATAPHDLQARSDTMFAAYCAGMAINTAGTAGAHAIQSPIGNLTHTPHGIGVGALLPYIMRYNLPARVPEFAEIGRLLGVADPAQDELAQARAGIDGVDAILAAIGIPADLTALGLRADQLDDVADHAVLATRLTDNNPRVLDREGILEILRRGLAGDRGWW